MPPATVSIDLRAQIQKEYRILQEKRILGINHCTQKRLILVTIVKICGDVISFI